MSVIGGAILVVSGALFLIVLIRGQMAARVEPGAYRFSVAAHPPRSLPAALNGFGLWLGLMIRLTIVNYVAFRSCIFWRRPGTAVPAIVVGAGR